MTRFPFFHGHHPIALIAPLCNPLSLIGYFSLLKSQIFTSLVADPEANIPRELLIAMEQIDP